MGLNGNFRRLLGLARSSKDKKAPVSAEKEVRKNIRKKENSPLTQNLKNIEPISPQIAWFDR